MRPEKESSPQPQRAPCPHDAPLQCTEGPAPQGPTGLDRKSGIADRSKVIFRDGNGRDFLRLHRVLHRSGLAHRARMPSGIGEHHRCCITSTKVPSLQRRRMGRLVHDLWIAQPRASLSSQGSVVLPSRCLPPRSPAADVPAHSHRERRRDPAIPARGQELRMKASVQPKPAERKTDPIRTHARQERPAQGR